MLLAVACALAFGWDAHRFFSWCVACLADLQRNYPSVAWWILAVAFLSWEVWRWAKRCRAHLPALLISASGVWASPTGWLAWPQVRLVVARWHGAATLHYTAATGKPAYIRWQLGELAISGRHLEQLQQRYQQVGSPNNSPTDISGRSA